ncbi:MAG: hypothetical protein LH606_12510 [Cytophagaceae bacterium]|nr:hypothetical protein [Cytophagaceae bacterium]
MKARDNSFFWPSYTDLMTSLFFVMLVLYVLTVAILRARQEGDKVDAEKFRKIQTIEQALRGLNGQYFAYDAGSKRFRLRVDANFPSNSADISLLSPTALDSLLDAGRHLRDKAMEVIRQNPEVNYMVVIEGNTQRNQNNFRQYPDVGYELSYKRALALYNFWQDNDVRFDGIPNCEVLLAGSGYFGKSRDTRNEVVNRRFTIQITTKVGKFSEK